METSSVVPGSSSNIHLDDNSEASTPKIIETSSVVPGSSSNIHLDGNCEAFTPNCLPESHPAALADLANDKLPFPICGLPSVQVPPEISAAKLFELVKLSQHCRYQDPWIVHHLSKSEHRKFMILLSSDTNYYHHKLRRDYDSENEIHVIRMPASILHETLLHQVLSSIFSQLEKLRNSPLEPVAEFVAEIYSIGSSDLTINEGSYSPDIQFQQQDAYFPGLVIEIAYSQTEKNLARLARSYIVGSHGNVRQVIGIEIEYWNKTHPKPLLEGRVTVWKPCSKWKDNESYLEAEMVIDHEVFAISNRDTLQSDKSIDIPLKVFETSALKISDTVSEYKISLKYSDLCSWLRRAEKIYVKKEHGSTIRDTLAPGQRTEELTPPPEVLTEDDEERFADLEEQDEARAIKRAG